MFQLNDEFLNDLGLNDLPEEQKKPFLQHIYNELELRVGTRLAEGLSDDQLTEFESIIERDEAKVTQWLESHVPNYASAPDLQKLADANGLQVNDKVLLSEYAATKWLEFNRPDYREVVAAVMGELKQEIISNRDKIVS